MTEKTYKLLVAYDGTDYGGWQIQPNAPTIQEELMKAAEKLGIQNVKIVGAGRTDAGVHAKAQCARLTGETAIPGEKLSYALNSKLPKSIRVVESSEVEPGFHPRYDAKGKVYSYLVRVSDHESPFYCDRSWHFPYKLDLEKMNAAARLLEGEHDFAAYRSSGGSAKTSVRRIDSIRIEPIEEENATLYRFTFTGNGFLYNMVRILVGTLLMAGQGRISLERIEKSLETGERKLAGPTAPPQGLTLEKVLY